MSLFFRPDIYFNSDKKSNVAGAGALAPAIETESGILRRVRSALTEAGEQDRHEPENHQSFAGVFARGV